MRTMLLCLAACAIAGCAADGGADQPFVEKTYRTGSNIAVSRTHAADDAATTTPEQVEQARNGARRVVPPSGSH